MGLFDALQFDPASYNQGGLLSRLKALIDEQKLNPIAPAQPGSPQYDAMGNPLGYQSEPTNPFGPVPTNIDPSKFQTPQQSSPFANGAAGVPFAGPLNMSSAVPQPSPDQQPQQQAVAPGMPLDITPKLPPEAQTDFSAQSRDPVALNTQSGGNSPFGSAGIGDRLMAGIQGFANSSGPMPALANLFNGLATGQRSDPAGVQQQNLKAQYDALVPMLGPQKAMLAILNPEAGKTLIAQALEKKEYSFQKLDNDTVVRQDPMTGKVDVAYGNPDRADMITGPDGKPIPIPPGVDRKTFVNEVSRAGAKAATGEKNEVQAKAEIFGNKMELANKTIGSLEGQGTSIVGKIASGVPFGNYAQSAEYQRYKQASSNFITALLRQESGAAISKSEFDRYDKEYMPQPGDSAEVLAQKAEARRVAIDGMKKGTGPGYKSPTGGIGIGQTISAPGGITIKRIN